MEEKKVVLITGASSGIGLELAKLFLDGGFKVYGASRKGVSADGAAGIKCDVSDPLSCEAAVAEVMAKEGRLDILVNNAGMGIAGAVENTEVDDAKYMFDVNFFGTFYMMKYALPHLREAKGRVVNISSVASKIAIPYQAFYSASKAAVDALSGALRGEAKQFGVKIVSILPGDAKTGFTAERVVDYEKEGVYAATAEKAIRTMEHDEQNGMEASAVAKVAYKAAIKKRPPAERIAGGQYRLLTAVAKFLPKALVEKVVGMIY